MDSSFPTRGQLERTLSQRIQALYRAQLEHRPSQVFCQMFDEKIAIIGAGPAGLTAAFYLAETGYRPTVFEKSEHPGGMLRYGIPSYKLEKDLLDAEIDVAKAMGVEIKTGIEVGKDAA